MTLPLVPMMLDAWRKPRHALVWVDLLKLLTETVQHGERRALAGQHDAPGGAVVAAVPAETLLCRRPAGPGALTCPAYMYHFAADAFRSQRCI